MTAFTWCRRCRRKRHITGTMQVSDTGVQRLRGHCPTCGCPLKAVVGKVAR